MTLLKNSDSDPRKKAEAFIESLEKETGVSRRFLEEARSGIERAFAEVPPENLPECLENIRHTVKTQAETEAALKTSLDCAQRLVRAEANLTATLHELKEAAVTAKERAAAAAMMLLRQQHSSSDIN